MDNVRAWLRERGAETIGHPGGTLYTHLGRIHDRLGTLGHPPWVCLAGLTHAAYGTDGFDLTLLARDDRESLRALIGTDAEDLVFRYGGCDRSRTWKALAETRQVWDRWNGRATELPGPVATAFADLSIVNELDVLDHDPALRSRYGTYFRELFATWEGLASPQALASARTSLR